MTQFPLKEFEIRQRTIRFTDELLFGRNFTWKNSHNFNPKVGTKFASDVVGFPTDIRESG